jgi:hypothetical protein
MFQEQKENQPPAPEDNPFENENSNYSDDDDGSHFDIY